MALDIQSIAEQRPQNAIHYFSVIGSTMTEGARLAISGAPHGSVVIADEQTAGVGRFGRHWLSEPESGIYCSILLRLPLEPASLPIVTLALGLAAAEAIEQTTGIDCDLRWPNDVLIRERKVAGILAQLHDTCIVAGIGINVNQTVLPGDLPDSGHFPEDSGGQDVCPRADCYCLAPPLGRLVFAADCGRPRVYDSRFYGRFELCLAPAGYLRERSWYQERSNGGAG